MNVRVYTRHNPECTHAEKRYWARCRCPKWLTVTPTDGPRRLLSAKTRSWEDAEREAERVRKDGQPRTTLGITVSHAVRDYLEDKHEQNVGDEWLEKLTYDLERVMLPWCERNQIMELRDVGLEQMKEFRKAWTGEPITKAKKQERYRAFFLYCVRHEWIRANPAAMLSKIRVDRVPTDYFTPEEFASVLWAVGSYHPKGTTEGVRGARQRAGAMLLLLRWSGLRLGDAARLERRRLGKDGRLFLYMAKTGDPVYVVLPPNVTELLHSLPNSNPKYFFWTGNGDPKTTVDDWWRTLNRIFKRANIGKRAHPHMLRDTFAVMLLLAGVPLEQVSLLLGHKSIKVTERHYAPWCKARQDQLEAAVKKSWTNLA